MCSINTSLTFAEIDYVPRFPDREVQMVFGSEFQVPYLSSMYLLPYFLSVSFLLHPILMTTQIDEERPSYKGMTKRNLFCFSSSPNRLLHRSFSHLRLRYVLSTMCRLSHLWLVLYCIILESDIWSPRPKASDFDWPVWAIGMALVDDSFRAVRPFFLSTPILDCHPRSWETYCLSMESWTGFFKYSSSQELSTPGAERQHFLGVASGVPFFAFFPGINYLAQHHGYSLGVHYISDCGVHRDSVHNFLKVSISILRCFKSH